MSFWRTCWITTLASVIPRAIASRTASSITSIFCFSFSAIFLKAAHFSSGRMSSHFTGINGANSSFSKEGKSFSLIFSMISLIFVIPLATISLMALSTSAALIFIFSAISLSFPHAFSPRISSHLVFFAKSMILSRTCLTISFALTIPLATATRTASSISLAFTFNFFAASFKAVHFSFPRISSHFTVFAFFARSMSFSLTCSTISFPLAIPFATASRTA